MQFLIIFCSFVVFSTRKDLGYVFNFKQIVSRVYDETALDQFHVELFFLYTLGSKTKVGRSNREHSKQK